MFDKYIENLKEEIIKETRRTNKNTKCKFRINRSQKAIWRKR